MTVLISGGGIAGLTLALTCQQIGVPFKVFEAAVSIKPLGVGINLQPNAVRELFELGLEEDLRRIGVETQEYGFYSKTGLEIWNEPRGTRAGYKWPQFSVHRGQLQMVLYRALMKRGAIEQVEPGWRTTGFTNEADGAVLHLESVLDGKKRSEKGSVVIGADGIHSAIRAQMEPNEPPPVWGGAVLWRGITHAPAFRTGASMAMAGHDTQRVVVYPISKPDPATGLSMMNWIAELTFDPSAGWNKEDWNRAANIDDFLPQFADWKFDWLDVPALIKGAEKVFEYPMVDRDPIDRWTYGATTLIGDAAHATYPVGSSGASQAVVDARKLGASFLKLGVTDKALQSFEDDVRPTTTKITLANRGSGPDAVMQMVEDRCQGVFDKIDDVIPTAALAAHAEKYKSIVGTTIESLNAMPSVIPAGARI